MEKERGMERMKLFVMIGTVAQGIEVASWDIDCVVAQGPSLPSLLPC